MVNNTDFSSDLQIKYLSILATNGKEEAFNSLYEQYIPSLSSRVDETTDRELLSDLKCIIDYKKKMTSEKGMGR